MLDTTNMAAAMATISTCPSCGKGFAAKRKNQQFCSRSCQKNSSRGPRTSAHSAEIKERNRRHYDRAAWLCHDLHQIPKHLRLGYMADIIQAAREHDGQLRVILTDPKLLGAHPTSSIGKFYPASRNPAVKNIAKAVDAFCRRFWGHGVKQVVYKLCPEPPTGELGDTEGHFPQATAKTVFRLRTKQPVRAPAGRGSSDIPWRICKGFRWLTVGCAERRRLLALGGCPVRKSASAL